MDKKNKFIRQARTDILSRRHGVVRELSVNGFSGKIYRE